MADVTLHDRLGILICTRTTYRVGCSCGWTYESENEEWAKTMATRHHSEAPLTPMQRRNIAIREGRLVQNAEGTMDMSMGEES